MDRALFLLLLLLSISQISAASFRVLLGDEVPRKNNSASEVARAKDEVKKPSLVSHTNDPSNQSELTPPISAAEEKEIQEPAPPAGKEKTRNPEKGNHTVLAPPVSQETIKSTNSTVGGAGTDMTGTETDTGLKKDDNVSKIKGLCDWASEKCSNEDNWIACLQHPSNDSKEIFLVVGNKGGNNISLDVKSTPSTMLDSKMLNLAGHDFLKVKILISETNHAADITISAGKSNCILHLKPATATFDWQKPFQQFASYATQLTPIYGAYVLLFAIGISLTTWVCCKFIRGRRRSDSGPAYQQLEMGGVQESQSNSVNADVTNTADGWENGWDDNWDDEEAVLGKPVATSGVSADGLSSRSYNNHNSKDGWEDWDD
ncbi:hypothetical protein LUZ62_077475 [Rhynchospora pubera]|uniref:DUF7356 domain-containing protein n=1 Tax=Rhynchospora pubera TaxID=906938 RepID=A0AAV8DKT7_9POAL|nr:hypothetical protein LUZ62_077475 [Rhynchospora pubera]